MLTPFPEFTGADHNPAAIYLARLSSAHSRRTMRAALNSIALVIGAWPDIRTEVDRSGRRVKRDVTYLGCNWASLRLHHTNAIRAKLSELYQPASVNKMLSALRGVLTIARDLDLISAEDYQRAVSVKSVKGRSHPRGRTLSNREIKALTRACKKDDSPAGDRDTALLGVLYTCGLRAAEVVALDLSDYDRDTGKLVIPALRERPARTVFVTRRAKLALEIWMIMRGLEAGALFCSIDKIGRQSGQRMTTQAIYKILKKRAEQAGVKNVSPHDLRRTFISHLLNQGADIVAVAQLAGHSSVYTTARYSHRSDEAIRKTVGLLHFPF